ncbi:MAG: GWxTD domain-containing protein [Gemmatimonadota bacterium]|nr:GWxTD domain-containing protein [Gemmatimonadota bacterium]
MMWTRVAALVVGLGPAALVAQGGGNDVAVTVQRFYRADVGTTVEGFCRVPFRLLDRVSGGDDAFAAYRVTIVVRDSSGLTLTEQSWAQRVPARVLGMPGASSVEPFRFAVAAGRYTLEVAVTDSASGRVTRAATEFRGYGQAPLASDVVLSSSIREGGPEAVAAAGEVRLGGFLVTGQTEPVLTPSQPRLFYYLELYPGAAAEAQVTARVVGVDGRRIVATQPEVVALEAAGVVTSGVDLTGLPPGEYRLALDVRLADTTVQRSARFRMAGFETEAAIAGAVEQASDVFTTLTEDQLDTLYRPLVYLMEGGERGQYEGLSIEGKRAYLRQFWSRRDPTPGTRENEAQRQFYELIARATREFREGGAGQVPGWRTDRGRIFVRYGEADEILRRPQSGPTRPYEVWKYTRGRLRKFVFYDNTGLGNYVLIYTDERREPSYPNWEQLLGPEAVADIQRF